MNRGAPNQAHFRDGKVDVETRVWELGDYKTIVDVAAKLSPNVVEEDPHLLMYFDLARAAVSRNRANLFNDRGEA